MAITRAQKPQSNFYLLDKSISEDRRLSWAARGLLIFLLGKPDYWKVKISNLIDQTSESSKASGRDGIYALLNELIVAGYAKRIEARDENGKFCSVDYIVSEIADSNAPVTEKPEAATVSPVTEKPEAVGVDSPLTANPTLVSINNKQGLKETSKDLSLCPKHQDAFEKAWSFYPKRSGDNPKAKAMKAWSARIKEGHSAEEITDGVLRYKNYCDLTGKTGTEIVKHAATFFGPDKSFLNDWSVPAHNGFGNFQSANKAQQLKAHNEAVCKKFMQTEMEVSA